MRFTAWTGLVVMIGLAAMGPQSLTAQNENAGGQSSKQKELRGPLPSHFGRLGASDSQKEKLYAIQDSYEEKIAALRKQIEQLESDRDKSMEALLTPGQKLRLQELREEARLNAAQAAAKSDDQGEP
ncbi:MAG: hypothetical protein AB7U20_02635 [Planctomycetaceae bacterium]